MSIFPGNYLFNEQWSLIVANTPDAWQSLFNISPVNAFGSPTIKIALVDSGGIDGTHPGLSGLLSDNTTQKIDPKTGLFDFNLMVANNDDAGKRNDGHGTLCAGVATAIATIPSIEGLAGVAGNCQLMGIIYPGATIASPGTVSQFSEAYKWIAGLKVTSAQIGFPAQITQGAHIITSSFGVFVDSPISQLMSDTFDMIVALGRNGRGTMMFFSSGNGDATKRIPWAQNLNTNVRPWSNYKKCLGIGASTLNINGFEEIWPNPPAPYTTYSNYGVGLEFVAPSSSISGGVHKPPTYYKIYTTCIQQDTVGINNRTILYDEHGGDLPGNITYTDKLASAANAAQNKLTLQNSPPANLYDMAALIGDPGQTGTEARNKIDAITGNPLILKDSYAYAPQFPGNTNDANLVFNHPANTNVHFGKRDYYTRHGETSAATPFAAGVAALVLSAQPNLSWIEAREIMRITARKIQVGFNGIGNNPGDPYSPYPNVEWVDKNNTTIISGPTGNAITLSVSVTTSNNFRLSDTIQVSSVANYNIGDAINIQDGINSEWRIVLGVDNISNILIIDPITANHSAGVTIVRALTQPYFSQAFGYGRVDAAAAVAAAVAYDFDSRDIKIRRLLPDNGAALSPSVTINSPDIWTRILDPGTDGSNAYPASFSVAGPNQQVYTTQDTYLYVQLNNIGTVNPTTLNSLDAWVRFFIAVSDGTPSGTQFSFPDSWYGEDDIVNNVYTSGTYVQLIGELEIPADSMTGDNGPNPVIPVPPNMLWPNTLKPHQDNDLPTYLLAQVAPFDGGIADTDIPNVYSNNNLSYFEIFLPKIRLKDVASLNILPTAIPVDTIGTVDTVGFNLAMLNLPFNSLNNVVIVATITDTNNTPQTVTFKYNGTSWAWDTTPTWMTLNTPVATGSNPDFQELYNFAGSFLVSNQYSNIVLNVSTTDANSTTVTQRDYTIQIEVNYPTPASGVAQNDIINLDTFTDFDQLPATQSLNYGPDSSSPSTIYRTWTAFTGLGSGTDLKSYAVSNGEVFIQIIPSTSLVNLILKPDAQPDCRYGHVRYFVYRGLKVSSFLDNSGNVLADNPPVNSDLINRMWVVRNNLNTQAGLSDVLMRGDLGLDEIGDGNPEPDTALIDDIFNLHVFQRVTQGMYLGDFDTSGNYGFEIILEGNQYQPTLGDVRVLDHTITINYQAGQNKFANNQIEDISTKLVREQALNYIDIAAYFGLLSGGQITVHKSSGNITANTVAQINTEVISKLTSTNNIYIDIRDELNNSLNFYGVYTDGSSATGCATVQFKDPSSSFVNKPYTNNGWPILVLNGSTDFATADPGDVLSADFMLPEGDNSNPLVYLSGSSFFTDSLNYGNKFEILTLSNNYTSDFAVSIANNPTIAALPFAVKLSFARRYDIANLTPVPAILTRIWKDDHLDNLLSPVDINITPDPNDLTNQNNVAWNSLSELKYLGWTSIKGAKDYTLRSGITRDSIGETVFAYFQGPNELAGATATSQIHSNLDFEKGKKASQSLFLVLRDIKKLGIPRAFALSGPSVNTIQHDSIYNKYSSDIMDKSHDDLLSMSYSSAEKTTIMTSVNQFLASSNCYYVALNHVLANDGNDIPYYVFELGVQGIVFDGANFTYTVQRLSTGINLYSLDGKSYFTEAYANGLTAIL